MFGTISYGTDCGCGTPTIATRFLVYKDWLNEVLFNNDGKRNKIKNEPFCQVQPSQSKQALVSISNEKGKNCTGIAENTLMILASKDCIEQLG